MLYPRIKQEVMHQIEAELLRFLLRDFQCADQCQNCLFCWKKILQDVTTQADRQALLEKLLIPIRTNESVIEFFEVRFNDGQTEYYNSLEKAQNRAKELEDVYIQTVIIGKEFNQ